MDGNSRRIIGVSLLCFLIALLAFAVYSIVTFEPKLVLPVFVWSWVWNQTLLLFIAALIPLECTAVLLYYSLVTPRRRRGRQKELYEPFYRMVNGVLVILLFFTLLFAVLSEAVRPALYAKRARMLDLTSLARMYYGDYQSLLHQGKFTQAEHFLDLYIKINPQDGAAQRALDKVRLDAAATHPKNGSQSSPPSSSTPQVQRYENESAQGLVSIAQSYLNRGDFASAHYYANLALDVSPGNAQAKRISTQSLHSLSQSATSPAQRKQRSYFALKSEGVSELDNGNAFAAYYLFRSLAKSHPSDPDVVTYRKRAEEALTRYAFFRDEIDKAAFYPGTKDVLFVNRSGRSGTEVVLIHKMVTLVSGTYAVGIEAAEFTQAGRLRYELTAPYGKMIGKSLSMFCIGRTRPVRYLPTVLSGSFPHNVHWQLPLSAGAGTLHEIGTYHSELHTSGMPRLWSLQKSLPQYGYPAVPLRFAFLRRVMIPFAFLIFTIFSIGFGWSLRPPGKPPSGFAFILVPLIPYVIYLGETFYLFSGKLLFGFIMTLAGFWPSLASLLVVQFLLVILSLVYLAGRSTDH